MQKPNKIIVLGSGSLKIGEAGEFDYSGSQCLKAIKEEGITTILVNPNIATNQTDKGLADKIYFLPVTPHFVEKVIEKEKPDGILLSFGGQTALNCGIALADKGVFEKHKVQVLGTQVQAIKETEDRELFTKKLKEIQLKTPESKAAYSTAEAIEAAKQLTYPVMLRAGYALGGQGSGAVQNEEELKQKTKKAFTYSQQILVEKYLGGWKEIEYEVVRDAYDNCITVCNMENFDPMGIHTGESIVVAPSQTLNNTEYHKLRDISIKTIRHLGIVGECNIQFALDPQSEDYRIIEVNARLSRSSALASKATGYPLAFIAAKLAIGYSLTELTNSITKTTKTCFEPALDYIVVKMPRWDLKKFKNVSTQIGSEMKSVGEVMAIGRKFEEAIQKATRMLGTNLAGITGNELRFENIEEELSKPTDKRLLAIPEAIKKGMSIEKIYSLTKINKWFLQKINNIIQTEQELAKHNINTITPELLKQAKQQGFSDEQLAKLLFKENNEQKTLAVRELRKKHNILPSIKQIDTLAGEYPAKTNYLYLTYNGTEDDVFIDEKEQKNIVVLGSGAYRIGSSVEFDWCCVNTIHTLKKEGYVPVMINYNPETVSTDYDICTRLYFDELSIERVLDIYEKEKPAGIIVSMGGQTPNDLALKLSKQNVNILGTKATSIDCAEDRHKFSKLLDELKIDQPEWTEATSEENAENFAKKTGYPVLIRPSYVLSGAAMSIASNKQELDECLKRATEVSREHPIVISKFITDAKEIEFDGVAKNGETIIYAISEHIENAGVHSGDATMVLPPQYTYLETIRRIKDTSKKIAKTLEITGPFNIQFIAKDNNIKVIECNLRASRSFPFVSKITKYNFIELATKSMLNKNISGDYNTINLEYVGVKAPQFSFSRLQGADPLIGVEMASTGEVACIGDDLQEALLKSLLSVGTKLPKKTILLSTGPIKNKAYLLESIRKLITQGYEPYATEGTHKFLQQNNIQATLLHWPSEEKEPNTLTYIKEGKIDMVINIPKNYEEKELTNTYLIRRTAIDFNVPLFTNAQITKLFFESIINKQIEELQIKSSEEYA